MNKGISIITNFGCRNKCWYCVWRGHSLENIRPETNWDKLSAFLKQYQHLGKVSVSGGGDPLFEYQERIPWWKQLFALCEENQILIDIHTREACFGFFWEQIHRVAFSCDSSLNIAERGYLSWLGKRTKVRLTHVVTKQTGCRLINDYLEFCAEHNFQLTLKQLSGFDAYCVAHYNELKRQFKERCYFLDNGDYNIYYMPNNKVYTRFLV